ncbi:MAG: carboxypeptidase-like regulatory domain-containing protein, partial [Vicinamibacterales bacterium]
MCKHKAVVMAATLLLWLSPVTWAQTSGGRILGVVQDASGGILPGATVVVRNLATSIARETLSNERGQYEVAALQPGQYQMEATLTGFRRYIQGPVTVQVGQATRVDATLQVGALNESITVVAAGIAVQTTTSSIGKVVEEKQILEL